MRLLLFFFLFLLALEALSSDFEFNPKRRRSQFSLDPGHFVYPMVADIPGMGTAYGVGGTAVNLFKTDIDVTGFHLRGDFDTTGLAILNLHLLPRFLILDFGHYLFRASTQVFGRGIDSGKDDYILPETEGRASVGQLTLTLFDRKLEAYTRYSFAKQSITKVRDAQGKEFENVDTSEFKFSRLAYGIKIDLTDDKIDPRNGVRFETEINDVLDKASDTSDYYTMNTNLSAFVPIRKSSTWGFNIFNSRTLIKNTASTDPQYLKEKMGLSCERISDPDLKSQCLVAETKLINERMAINRYGQATSLGGTQRLRSFPNGRFTAGNALFAGTEFRLNLTDERTFIDYYILKGVRTNIQLALFAETGTVVEQEKDYLKSDLKHSYGAGFRLCFSGVILRFDGATGNEGFQMQMFLDYPWNLYAIDGGL